MQWFWRLKCLQVTDITIKLDLLDRNSLFYPLHGGTAPKKKLVGQCSAWMPSSVNIRLQDINTVLFSPNRHVVFRANERWKPQWLKTAAASRMPHNAPTKTKKLKVYVPSLKEFFFSGLKVKCHSLFWSSFTSVSPEDEPLGQL